MHLLAFWLLPFIIIPGLVDYTAAQTFFCGVLIILTILLYVRRRYLMDLSFLPWIIWPVSVFLSASADWVGFSDIGLHMAALLFLSFAVYFVEKRFISINIKVGICVGLALYFVQLIGLLTNFSMSRHFALKSLFSQENVYQSISFLAMIAFISCLIVDNNFSRVWKFTGIVGVVFGLLSLIGGDYWVGGSIWFSSGDSIAIQMAVAVSVIAALVLFNIARLGINTLAIQVLVSAILIVWALLPLLLIQCDCWSNSFNTSITSRLTLWQSIFAMVHEHPWGVGIGGLPVFLYNYWPDVSQALYPATTFFVAAHNYNWQYLAEMGWLGFGASLFLWVIPTVWNVGAYLRDREKSKLLIASVLIGWQWSMVFSEVTQMFPIVNIYSWGLLMVALKMASPKLYTFEVSGKWLLLLLPVIGLLLWDRGHILMSQRYTAELERGFEMNEDSPSKIGKALEWHMKNPVALYFSAENARLNGDLNKSAQYISYLESIGDVQNSTSLWASLYKTAGQDSLACYYSWKKLRYARLEREMPMRIWAETCPLSWRHLK